jgi:hypothetical protein
MMYIRQDITPLRRRENINTPSFLILNTILFFTLKRDHAFDIRNRLNLSVRQVIYTVMSNSLPFTPQRTPIPIFESDTNLPGFGNHSSKGSRRRSHANTQITLCTANLKHGEKRHVGR